MKIGMTSLTFRNRSVEEVVQYAKKAGVHGIEWGVSDGHMPLGNLEQAEKIKALSKENGIEIFSLGAYCHMENNNECDKVLETAIMLGAPVIRIWAGEKSPRDCDESHINRIVINSVYMAKQAKQHSIRLGFEYHQNTLTENAESAVALINRINMNNVGLYWQPNGMITPNENLKERNLVLPYSVGNMHIHNYCVKNGYQPLSDIRENLYMYFDDIKKQPYNIMIEFVKDSILENFIADVKVLRELLV